MERLHRAILRPQDELALVDFADKVHEVVPFTNQPRQVEEGLDNIQRGDETALYDAISFASDRLAHTAATAGRRRVLVVISDGGDDTRHTGYADAIEAPERAGLSPAWLRAVCHDNAAALFGLTAPGHDGCHQQ